ncbi:hypothetical protein AFE_0456 [Acidithiobacillus ferrooxidans ATCC 23270]|uniref:Uncharacterized protein n=1 Tax=Acidithiobacillus ferrooxidans (strain ATCC 23270 / DSM 14882 / CIP 104768 / NCIMB 8455) TaxID=243159 RepID=B7J4J8_ACIF2|nr:hypothetical protein AFE_0456 [Acidithiobacillus ferrooxidans ATCC 23270]
MPGNGSPRGLTRAGIVGIVPFRSHSGNPQAATAGIQDGRQGVPR